VCVPGDQRTPRAYKVEISTAIRVEHLRTRCARDEKRCAAYGAKGAYR